MWKTNKMESTFERCLEGAKQAGFNGCIKYQDQDAAVVAKQALRPHLDEAYDLVAYQGQVMVEVNMEYCAEPRLRVSEFLKAVIATNPVEAEFEAEDEDSEQYQMNLADGQWVLLQRSGDYQEVA